MYTSSQGDKGPNRDDSWRLVSPAYYSFYLVRQENSVIRGDEYQSWYFLRIFLIILEKPLITGGNDL